MSKRETVTLNKINKDVVKEKPKQEVFDPPNALTLRPDLPEELKPAVVETQVEALPPIVVEEVEEVIPAGLQKEKSPNDYLIQRNGWGAWKVINAGKSGRVPEALDQGFTTYEQAESAIITCVTKENAKNAAKLEG